MDGFAFSGEAIVGLRSGEKNLRMLRISVNRLLQWTLWTGLFFSACYFIGLEWFTSLLTDSDNVNQGVIELTPWISLIPIVSCWAFIYDGFYIGITDTFKMMISTLIGGLIFFAVVSLNKTGPEFLASGEVIDANQIIWTAFLGYLLIRGLYLAAMWPGSLRKKLDPAASSVTIEG